MSSSLRQALQKTNKRPHHDDEEPLQHTLKRLRVDSKSPSPVGWPFPQEPHHSVAPAQHSQQVQAHLSRQAQHLQSAFYVPQQRQRQHIFQQQQLLHESVLPEQEFDSHYPPPQSSLEEHASMQDIPVDSSQHQQSAGEETSSVPVSEMNRLLGQLHQERRRLQRQRGERHLLPSDSQLY